MSLRDKQPPVNETDKRFAPPAGFLPGYTKVDAYGVPGEITTPAVTKPATTAEEYKKIVADMGVNIPDGYHLVLANANYDPAAWHRDEDKDEDGRQRKTTAVTRPVWRYKFRVEKDTAFTNFDLPALYEEIEREKSDTGPLHRSTQESVTMVIAWADVQTGKTDSLGGMKELLERLEEKRERLRERIELVRPDHIIIADAGDIIEGQENIPSQIATNGLSLMDQVDVAATELQKTIHLVNDYTDYVDVLSIPSNHCQARRGRALTNTPHDDWGLHINKRLEQLNEYVHPYTKFTRSPEWSEFLSFPVRNTSLGLVHGHQASGPNGIINWWAKQTHAGALNVDILLSGHYHFMTMRPSGRNSETGKSKYWLQAPTLDNGSAWVANKMGEDGDPGLLTFLIDDDGFRLDGLAIL